MTSDLHPMVNRITFQQHNQSLALQGREYRRCKESRYYLSAGSSKSIPVKRGRNGAGVEMLTTVPVVRPHETGDG